ncbi:Oligoribonuclease [Thalictrum thalictroides]|uniref:Oligoribonuclease n=1 Tax=Thalictrum thalictroides TaxID=46969 RepID=A0A7J6VJG9_THATH|nr:Oligoribonuclease [Thalictrum thalictroides]
MDDLLNAFAILELDVEDDKQQITQASKPPKHKKKTSISDKGKQIGGKLENKAVAQNAKQIQQNPATTSEECKIAYKGKQIGGKSENKAVAQNVKQIQQNPTTTSEECRMALVWIDLEMTGLDIQVDRILEIACIITDGNLSKSVEGPDLVIHQSKECLDKMGEWCQSHHADSGLTKKVLQSTIDERNAEKQVLDFVKKHVGTRTPLLAGNSVYVDFMFLKKYMPDLASAFSHVLVDVSSIKALCIRWYPRDNKKAPNKENKHRAMDDIKESIRELKYYKDNIFKGRSKK